jgi:hypothetical protein
MPNAGIRFGRRRRRRLLGQNLARARRANDEYIWFRRSSSQRGEIGSDDVRYQRSAADVWRAPASMRSTSSSSLTCCTTKMSKYARVCFALWGSPSLQVVIACAHRADDAFLSPIATGEYGFRAVGIHAIKRDFMAQGWNTELEIVEFARVAQ